MHYFIFPEKDTTIFQMSASKNTGLDEILEVRKDLNASGKNPKVSRVLIQFDLNEISNSMVRGTIDSDSARFYLNLYDANPTNLSYTQSLYAYAVSQSWVVGEGFSADSPLTEEGCSWRFRDGQTAATLWTGSISASGGTWFDDVYASQSFTFATRDVRMDVTPIVNKWLGSTRPNDGFILKRSGSVGNLDINTDEGSNDRLGNFSFFSRQTNTIYPPKLEVEWYDTKWNTGSLSPLNSTELEDTVIYMKNIRKTYKENSKVKFRLVGRGRYPTRSASNTSSEFLTVKYLPSGSVQSIGGDGAYYSVRDADTEEVIVPYGTGSLISCDSTGNYFNLWMNGFQSERYYKFEFKVVSGSNTVDEVVNFYDEDYLFKVVR
tara:strand:+ start:11866 stop:12996 length:1131 start_codon:yes stop_codon:yes gene_type:complete